SRSLAAKRQQKRRITVHKNRRASYRYNRQTDPPGLRWLLSAGASVVNGRSVVQLQVPVDVRNRRHKSRLYSPVYVVPPFLSDVSLSSPFRMVLVFIFRFVSFDTALW